MKPLVIMISVSILTYGAMLDCTPDTLVQDNACSCGRYNCGVGNICHKYNEQTYCAILSGQTQVTLCGSDYKLFKWTSMCYYRKYFENLFRCILSL